MKSRTSLWSKVLCAVILLLATSFMGMAYARGGSFGGSRSFSRSSSSFSRSSSSFGRSSRSSRSYSAPSKSKSYSSKQATGRKSFSASSKTAQKVSMQQQRARSAQFNSAMKTEQSKFSKIDTKRTVTPNTYRSDPVYRKLQGGYDYRTYRTHHDTYYVSHHWVAPSYYYHSYPSFGVWDAAFIWMMLEQHNSAFFYNHQNDPAIQQWRSEAVRLESENADLKAQLATVDAQTAAMKGKPIDASYLPAGTPPEAALAADVVAQKQASVPVATDQGHSHVVAWVIGILAALVLVVVLIIVLR